MKLKTNIKVPIAKANEFELEQGEKGIKKQNILNQDPCYWEVLMTGYGLTSTFKARIRYFQLQPYQEVDEEGNTVERERPVLMFDENFKLEGVELQQLWEYLDGHTTLITNIEEGLMDFYLNGFIARMGIKNILGLTSDDWDVIQDDKI